MNVYIAALSDNEPDMERRKRWGDYWFKESLAEAMRGLGHTVVEHVADADVLINCHGGRVASLPEWTWNVLWIIGHPAAVTVEECESYDAVYAESEEFTAHLVAQGIPATRLAGASDFVPMKVPRTHDAVFVGNWRPGRSIQIPPRHILEIWGEGWEGNLPDNAVLQGKGYPHEELNALYASATMLVNQEHADMRQWGMHNPRHYDSLAVAGQAVPTFADCAADIMEDVPEYRPMLDLGCGSTPRRGMLGIDKCGGANILPWDLEMGIPGDSLADVIVADNVLEHIDNLVPLLNDCHDALLPKGRMHIVVPNAKDAVAAWADPTHRRAFVVDTFTYFDAAHPRWAQYGKGYGIKPWHMVYVREDGRFVRAMMRPMEVDA
jgi:Ni,Fe-hydrogenase III small subunit